MLDMNNIPKEEVLTYLPTAFVEEIGEMLSTEGVIWLIQNHGGTDVFIPKSQALGQERFPGLCESDIQYLCLQCASTMLSVPKGTQLQRFIRNQNILQALDSGSTRSMVARDFDITERHVRRIESSFKKV